MHGWTGLNDHHSAPGARPMEASEQLNNASNRHQNSSCRWAIAETYREEAGVYQLKIPCGKSRTKHLHYQVHLPKSTHPIRTEEVGESGPETTRYTDAPDGGMKSCNSASVAAVYWAEMPVKTFDCFFRG